MKNVDDFIRRYFRFDIESKNYDEYVAMMSCSNSVGKIKFPFITLCSKDDNISPTHKAPLSRIHNCPNWVHIETKGGGHLGFNSGPRAEFVSFCYKLATNLSNSELYLFFILWSQIFVFSF